MTFRKDFEHRDELLQAAVTEFADRGYENASINRILDRSGMSKGQLYHHFDGKEGLFLALVEWMIDLKGEWLRSRQLEVTGDFVSSLRAQINGGIEFAAAHPDVDRMSRALLAERGRPIFARVVSEYSFDSGSALAHLVEQCYATGQFRRDLSLDFVRRAVLTLVNQLPELLELDRPGDLGGRVEELLTFLRSGMLEP